MFGWLSDETVLASRQHLHCDLAAEPRVLGAVDLAHAARAERGDDLVGTEAGAGS
jgi:hypothetical protein